MEVLGKRLPSPETIGRFLANLTRPEKEKKPLIAAFYLTFDCNARCNFCSQSKYVYGDSKGKHNGNIELEKRLSVLRKLREDVPNIYFLGGEPTVYPDFEKILQESADLGFDTIGVNTNGLLYKPEILSNANLLVVSLHSVDPAKIASIYGVTSRWGVQALENIKRYANERNDSAVQMTINCVITGNNIMDVYKIAEFCRTLGIQLNVAPAILDGGRPDERLMGNPEYHTLINWLLNQNGLIASSRAYLEIIREFEPFVCTPHVIPGIYPNGDVVVPCPELSNNQKPVNLFEAGGLNKALKLGRAKFEDEHGVLDTRTRCAEMCHKTCYIEGSGISTINGLARLIHGQLSPFLKEFGFKD